MKYGGKYVMNLIGSSFRQYRFIQGVQIYIVCYITTRASLCLTKLGEANKVGANAETGTRARSDGHRRHEGIKNAKGRSSRKRNEGNFIKVERALRDRKGGKRHHDALDEVLDGTLKSSPRSKSFTISTTFIIL